jgi:membrane-associated PAP2 superfamily phosphatase
MKLNRDILITTILLIVSILFFGISNFDVNLQDNFYDFQTHMWIVDETLQPYKFIFYDGIKSALLILGAILIVIFIYALYKKKLIGYQKGLLIVIVASVLVPVVVGSLKKITNMPCPHAEIRYNGEMPRTAVWECYAPEFCTMKQRECWPAGHASGGFALLSLFFLFHTKRNRYLALAGAMAIGWSMGMYKMLVGDHFFSHTVITMLIAWLIVLLTVKMVNKIPYYQKLNYEN